MANYFSTSDLEKIAANTERNNHAENYLFIATKIKSKLKAKFRSINKKHMKKGYLDEKLSNERNKLISELMEELKEKSPSEFNDVNRVL